MSKERDFSIDFFKGVTVVSIIFIHTVWWSGEEYIPNIVAQFSLLIDVPLFFFLSGASATYSFSKEKSFSGIVRLIGLFTLFFGIYAVIFEPENIFDFITRSIFIQYPWTEKIRIVSSSTWFIPVFILVYLIGYLIISHIGKNKILPIICILLLLFMYKYESIDTFKSFKIFSITPDYIFANLFFFLFGYYYHKKLKFHKRINHFSILLLITSSIVIIYHFSDIPFNLQIIKFPHRFYYVVASMISISITIILSRYITKEYFLNYFGKNALQFYLAQGVGSGLLFIILPYINLAWPLKLIVAFTLNLSLTICFSITITFVLKYYLINLNRLLKYVDNFDIRKLTSK